MAQQAVGKFWSAPWYTVLLGALERAFALPIQISFSLLVLQSLIKRQPLWLLLAIGWHALVDGITVYALGIWGAYVAEAMVGASCLLSLAVIFALRQPEPIVEQVQPELSPSLLLPRPIDFEPLETPEKLDKTRYL